MAEHESLGRMMLVAERDDNPLLFYENESNAHRLWGAEPEARAPKDGINDHVVKAPTRSTMTPPGRRP